LAIERFFAINPSKTITTTSSACNVWLHRITLFIVVGVAWVFFRTPSVQEAFHFFAGIGTWHWQPEYWVAYKFLALFSIPLFLLDLRLELSNEEYAFQSLGLSPRIAFGAAIFLLMLTFGANQPNAFIYFQF